MAPAKRGENGDPNRGSDGRFKKGNNANPRGRAKLPDNFKDYAEKAPDELMNIATSEDTPVKVRADILKWFSEMWFGKAPQALDLEGKIENSGTQTVKFEGVLEEWSQ